MKNLSISQKNTGLLHINHKNSSMITIKLSSTPKSNSIEIDFDESGITKEEFLEMSDEKKSEFLQKYIDAENDNNRPYWKVEEVNVD
jgi:hypothetical protein